MLQPEKKHIEFQIPPQAHTSMYNWHKYWARKTWNVVGEWIESYCPVGGIVIDPFMGSGVTVIEAARRGRKAIGIDLNPVAVEIVDLTLRDTSLEGLKTAFAKVERAVARDIESLYMTVCRKCQEVIPAACYIWNEGKPQLVRYECPHCNEREIKGKKLTKADVELIEGCEALLAAKNLWYPDDKLYYPDGSPFKEKQRFESISNLFTSRNLYCLAVLMRQIEREKDDLLRRFLKITFSSMVHNCTRMMPVGNPADTNHYTFFSSPGWTQHSYWHTTRFMEQPVWRKYKSAFLGHQGIMNAKEESSITFKSPVRFGNSIDQLLKDRADVVLINGSALPTLRALRQEFGGAGFADFCFTDPPYAASIQYGELSFMWAKWLGFNGEYLKSLCDEEVVENPRQNKSFEYYEGMLSSTLGELYECLRPGAHTTITFHNPTFRVRNATIRAAVRRKFDFEKIHHQPTAVTSAKSLLQPFGSATGDFYLRFSKPIHDPTSKLSAWDEKRFDRVVMDGVLHVLAERWEPTPYTIIINFIDPLLSREGFFQELYPGLDVNTVLKNHEGEELVLVDVKIGGQEGKAWWFKHPESVQKKGVPLSERVEQSVIRELSDKRTVTFTDIWRRVAEDFPNSLTPDAMSIRDVLKEYAAESKGGDWRIQPRFSDRIKQHSLMIWNLAEIGGNLGYKVWIGRNEQRESTPSGNRLNKLVSLDPKSEFKFSGEQLRSILDMDVLWVKRGTIQFAFEVEYSTSITSAVERGSHLPAKTRRYILLPEERIPKFKRKCESPFFLQGLTEQGWRIILFDKFTASVSKIAKGTLELEDIAWDFSTEPDGKNASQLRLRDI
ncbi:hypothetical protein HZB60_11225 [candidate division KSB1 bacterium]|nr:hypothetical protein [candidate division KSB1 bacterium]